MPIRSFLDLDVYQKSYQAALTVNKEIVPKLPDTEKFDLKDQLRRASKAIPAIIAEGYAKKHHKRDWQKYIDDAIGEANEMIVHLSLVKDLYPNFIDVKLCEELIKTYDIIGKQLFRLGKSWNCVPQPQPPHPDSPPTSHPHSIYSFLTPFALSVPTYGQIAPPSGVPSGGLGTLEKILQVGLTLAIILALILTVFFIIFSGIQWITSGGDKQKLQNARNRLTYAIVGLIVVLLAIFLVRVIGGVFNVNLLNVNVIQRQITNPPEPPYRCVPTRTRPCPE